MSNALPHNIYGYVKARAGRSQIIAAVINNINNSWFLLLHWTGSWAVVEVETGHNLWPQWGLPLVSWCCIYDLTCAWWWGDHTHCGGGGWAGLLYCHSGLWTPTETEAWAALTRRLGDQRPRPRPAQPGILTTEACHWLHCTSRNTKEPQPLNLHQVNTIILFLASVNLKQNVNVNL